MRRRQEEVKRMLLALTYWRREFPLMHYVVCYELEGADELSSQAVARRLEMKHKHVIKVLADVGRDGLACSRNAQGEGKWWRITDMGREALRRLEREVCRENDGQARLKLWRNREGAR